MAVFLIPVGWELILLAAAGTAAVIIYTTKTAQDIISEKKLGSINKVFPGQWLDKTLEEIQKAADDGDASARSAKKLLTNTEYDKKK
jgi:hypothetical protein